MPDLDPTHTASNNPRKDDLSSLYRQWDARDAGTTRPRGDRGGVGLRIVLAVALMALAVLVMVLTARDMSFWVEPGEPRDLGDLRERVGSSAGTVELEHDNSHVSVRGLVPTRLLAVQDEHAPEREASYLFYCPLAKLVVFTDRAVQIPDQPGAHPDPRLAFLVDRGLALAAETAVSVTGQGRLMRASGSPSELRPFVQSFAQRVQRPFDALWVLVDGARPADDTWAALVWALAAAAAILSSLFMVRTIRFEWRKKGARS